jgi:hypothetical protein
MTPAATGFSQRRFATSLIQIAAAVPEVETAIGRQIAIALDRAAALQQASCPTA